MIFVVLVIILTSGYALTTTVYSPIIYSFCALGIVVSLFKVEAYKGGFNKIRFYFTIVVLILLVLSVLISSILNLSANNLVSSFKFLLVIILAATVFLIFEFRVLAVSFANFMYYISIISLLGYLAINLNMMPLPLSVIDNVNGMGYKVGYFFFAFDGIAQYRNIGIFWEPGIFASMIYCTLLIDAFVSQQTSISRLGVFFIALMTTFSGGGIILFLIYVAIVVNNFGLSSKFYSFGLKLIVVCGSILIYFIIFDEDILYIEYAFEKIVNYDNVQLTRVLSPFVSFEVYAEKPIFGWGFVNAIEKYTSLNQYISLTSTSIYFMSAFGVMGAFYSLIPMVGIFTLKGLSRFSRFLVCLSYIFIVNKEPHTYFAITHVINFYLLFELCKYIGITIDVKKRSNFMMLASGQLNGGLNEFHLTGKFLASSKY